MGFVFPLQMSFARILISNQMIQLNRKVLKINSITRNRTVIRVQNSITIADLRQHDRVSLPDRESIDL